MLLVKHSYGPLNWELPGGAAERDESPPETSVREVLEETGLRVIAERLTGVYYERHGPGREAVHFVFLCRIVDEVATPRPDLDEVTACAYWPRCSGQSPTLPPGGYDMRWVTTVRSSR